MATQKDLLRTAILSGAVEGMSMSEGVIDVAVPTEIPERGFSVPSPITGYCVIRVITTKGANQGGAPWFSLEHLRGTENFNGSWFATGGVATITPVTKGHEVRIATMDATVNYLRFIKVIGGGCSRYLPSLSRNRFGGALWLRLKTASETLQKQGADRFYRRVSKLSLRRSALQHRKESASMSLQRTAMSLFGVRVRRVSPQKYVSTDLYSCCQLTPLPRGGERGFLAPVAKSFTTHFGALDSSKASSTSFLLSVASNNARMEVAA